MKLTQLELFIAIAEEGQIGRAAARVGMTQPAVTKNLIALESALGNKLFLRSRSGVTLTPAGRLLLGRARSILQGTRDAERELAEFSNGSTGRLRLGAGPTMAEYLLPRIIGNLLKHKPRIEVKIMSALNDTLFDSLRADDLDLVLSAIPEAPAEGLEHELLMHDESVVVLRAKHPLLRKRHVTLRELANQSWVLAPRRVITREWLTNAFERHNLPPPCTTVEADSALAIAIAANSDLLTFQPRSNVIWFGSRYAIDEIPCRELNWRRPIGLSYRAGSYRPRIAQQFLDALRSHAKALSPAYPKRGR